MMNRPADVAHTDAALLKQILPGTEQKMWSDGWTWGVLPDDWDREDPKKFQQDTEFANHTIEILKQKHAQPFFVTCGFWRPHVSWTVPKRTGTNWFSQIWAEARPNFEFSKPHRRV